MKKIALSDFNKNAIKLITGASMAQAIPVAISPILTRIYSPEDFGLLAIFVAITAIFGSIANGRYELAIVLPEKEEDSLNLVALSIIIAGALSFFLLLIVIFLKGSIVNLLGNNSIGPWLYTVPFVVLFIGVFNALNYYNTRIKAFGLIARVKVIKAVSLASVQIFIGLIISGAFGLISGQIVSHVFANGRLARNLIADKTAIRRLSIKKMKLLGLRHLNFPKFSMPAVLANTLTMQSPNFFISAVYSASTLGYYSLIHRTLNMPLSLISQSFGQVFFQKAAEEKNEVGNSKKALKSTFIQLLIIGLPLFILLFFILENVIAIVFGENWHRAGELGKYILPLMFMRFLINPLSTINSVYDKQKISLVWQIILLLLSFIIFSYSYIFDLSIENFLLLFSLVLSFHYLILMVIIWKISGGNENENTSR